MSQAFIPFINLSTEEKNARITQLAAILNPIFGSSNAGINNEFANGAFAQLVGLDFFVLARNAAEVRTLRAMAYDIAASGEEPSAMVKTKLKSAITRHHNSFVSILAAMQNANVTTQGRADAIRDQFIASIDGSILTRCDMESVVNFLARIAPRSLTISRSGLVVIELPGFLMENDFGYKAYFKMKLKVEMEVDGGILKMMNVKGESNQGESEWRTVQVQAPHCKNDGNICRGENSDAISRARSNRDWQEFISRYMNSLDLYNESSPYYTIHGGFGTFCDLTGEHLRTRIERDMPLVGTLYVSDRANQQLQDNQRTYEAFRYKPKHAFNHADYVASEYSGNENQRFLKCAISSQYPIRPARNHPTVFIDTEFLLQDVRKNLVWGDAIKRIGFPTAGEKFIESGLTFPTIVRNSDITKVRTTQTSAASDGLKIILRDDWFDIAFHEMSRQIHNKLTLERGIFGDAVQVPALTTYIPGTMVHPIVSKYTNEMEQRARQLLESIQATAKPKRQRPSNRPPSGGVEAEGGADQGTPPQAIPAPAAPMPPFTPSPVASRQRPAARADDGIIEVGVIDTTVNLAQSTREAEAQLLAALSQRPANHDDLVDIARYVAEQQPAQQPTPPSRAVSQAEQELPF